MTWCTVEGVRRARHRCLSVARAPPKFASTRACVVSRWRDAWFRARLAVQVAIHARSSAAAAHDSASEASHRLAAEAHTELALAIVLASGGDAAAAVDAVDAVLSGRGLSPPPLPGGVGDAVADQRSASRGRAAKKEPVHEGDLAQAATTAAVVPEYVSTALIANAKAAADVVAAARAVPPPVASDVARGEVPDRGTRLPVWSDDEVRVSAASSAGIAVPHAALCLRCRGVRVSRVPSFPPPACRQFRTRRLRNGVAVCRWDRLPASRMP